MVAVLPSIALASGGLFAFEAKARLAALAVGAAGFLLCTFVRDAGRKAQIHLWREWGGSPTLQRLRFRESAAPDRVARLHARLQPLVSAPLPTEGEEAANPERADERYDEAIAELRQLTRAGESYKVLAAENADYGFRRNLYGIRPFGLAVAGTSAALALLLLIVSAGTFEERAIRWGPGLIFGLGAVVLFAWIVQPAWVRLAAERYADRLFEATGSFAP